MSDFVKQIFFVKNTQVWENISKHVDKNSVAKVYDFNLFDESSAHIVIPDEFPIDDLENFKSDSENYHAVIALNTGIPKDGWQFSQSFFFRLSLAVARTLKRNGIKFSFWEPFSPFIHIYGELPNMVCENTRDTFRLPKTFDLISEVFQTFPQEFAGKKIDMWIAIEDTCAIDALDLAEALDLPHVFSYYTTHAMKDRVIALPDFNCCYNEDKFWDPINITSQCMKIASLPWEDSHLFWRGSLFVSFSRRCLFELGKKFPQYLKIEDMNAGENIPMIAQAKYKYLIDTRGNSWSGRLQTLLKLGRVVFIADRPYREWYFDKLKPWEHYVPVKEDMSDLIEKICHMERRPELYEKIVGNLREFVEENLTPRRIVFDTKELILRYGVVE